MFNQIFVCSRALARHRDAPLSTERGSFLSQLADRGLSRKSLQRTAANLLVVVQLMKLSNRAGETITREEIRRKCDSDALRSIATRWLRFLGRLEEPSAAVSPFAEKIEAFVDYMEHERDLASATIRNRCWSLSRILHRLESADGALRDITPDRIDGALRKMLDEGKYSRGSVQHWASNLRSFFRFAELRGWCRKGLADSIRGPRVYSQASLPVGPSWDNVRRMLATTEGDLPTEIRDRAILMLLSIYGLRAREVRRLRLDDFDWKRELLTVEDSKTRRTRTWPLNRTVGDAVLRYLEEVRPQSSHREMFLTVHSPFRPMRYLWGLVSKRLRLLNHSLPHYGPHALRHACATRLLDRGLSLKEIGDHLGHRDPDTTRIYAKVDLAGLREVADFDLGGLQ